MEVGELLGGQYAQAHELLQGVLAEADNALVNDAAGLGTLGSIGSIYAHVVFTEDALVSGFKGGTSLYESTWKDRIGVEMPGIQQSAAWASGVTLDLVVFNHYAAEVFAATDAYMRSLTAADLDREVPGIGGRTVTLGVLAGNVGIIHVNEHMGEIAAIKGMRGLKGLPF